MAADFQNLTYDDLELYIQQYLNRNDTLTIENISSWINLAEKQLAIRLKNLGSVTVITSSVDPTGAVIHNSGVLVDKPALWHSTKSLAYVPTSGSAVYLYPRTYEYLQIYLNDFADLSDAEKSAALPQFYCDYNQEKWLIGPYISTDNFNLEQAYYSQITPLSATNQQNFWTLYAPMALLYGSLVEACNYLRSDDRLASFMPKYEAAVNDLLGEGAGRVNDAIIVRTNV